MPCITYETPAERAEAARRERDAITGPLHREIHELKRKLAERDAMLCGVFRALENGVLPPSGNFYVCLRDVLYMVDWFEAGVSATDTMAWWEEHQRRDLEERDAKRKAALNKLTEEEKKLLGL